MLSPVNNNLTGLAFETSNKQAELEATISKLSSGNKLVRAGDDTGGYSQSAKIGATNKRHYESMHNLQNVLSYCQTQDGILSSVGDIISRIGELAARALDITANDSDRENYNKEFMELVDQLEKISNEEINGLPIFGAGGFSDDKKQFIESLHENWLKASEDLITQEYGWTPNANDSWELIVNENDSSSNYAAFVSTSWDGNGVADVIEMQFDLPDFAAPHTQPDSTADMTVAHEMVHLMQAQNSYFGDLIGDGVSGGNEATWFKEGLAEFIAGSDSSVRYYLNNGETASSLASHVGSGNEAWVTGEQYAAGYLAVRYLHDKIMNSGVGATGGVASSEGIKHMTKWMKDQFDAGAGAAASGINAYFTTFGGVGFTNNSDFISKFKAAGAGNGVDYITNNLASFTTNPADDTGSVRGSDANGGGAVVNAQDSVPDATGDPTTAYVKEEEKGSLNATIDGSGSTYSLKTVNTVTISDTSLYNLLDIDTAKVTLQEVDFWLESVAEQRSIVGANTSRLEKEIQNLTGKISTGEMAHSRISDTDVALESSRYAAQQVRTQASMAILAQGQKLNVGIPDLLRGVMVGRS